MFITVGRRPAGFKQIVFAFYSEQ